MKKILAALLVLALAIPAMADVAVTGTDLGSGHLQIKVAPTGGASVRGVALKLTRTAGNAYIDATTDATATQFNTFIDYAFTTGAGYTIGSGHCLANPTAAGVLAAFPASTFSLCAGYLDQSGGKAGVTVDSFFDIFFEISVDSTFTVELDPLRGGIVGDTLGTVTVQSPMLVAGNPPETISKPTVAKTTAAPAIAGRVNGGRVETFVASGAASNLGHALEYQFTWGDGNVSTWGAATQTYTYTYAAAATYNVTVQARCIAHPAVVSAMSDALAEATEAVKSTATFYAAWAQFGRLNCWAFKRNCRGDADGVLNAAGKGGVPPAHWVGSPDLGILAASWQKAEALTPVCGQTNYWYWTN